jgi:hypothetical protein
MQLLQSGSNYLLRYGKLKGETDALLYDIKARDRIKEGPMPIPESSHVSGWEEATLEEKLEGLHDWCNILTAKLKAASEETSALRERVKKLESAPPRIEIESSRELATLDLRSRPAKGAERPF